MESPVPDFGPQKESFAGTQSVTGDTFCGPQSGTLLLVLVQDLEPVTLIAQAFQRLRLI